ncbi:MULTISPECIES: NgoPII family restriction endonuclease [Chryseobacterium]|uniref:NgoPII restriction endonuclease n=1 Tax=Chryseobacterium taihuense TaxID=1141221 RepID=A0A4U8WM01_9FLAO|nr:MULTISPECIES: NgoPII family restriction endonuclease [Chryseobacterium]QQV02848.1 NgoPII family restriction endonuclease [Chryseobacterium sp. FDAARGOS 1104]VFB03878.1 NgoPII restriction endonuclease [Chryseobacterium taihuense]
MTNILEAIINISKLEDLNIEEVILGNNRAVNMGEGLESFVKNAFSNAFGIEDKNEKNRIYSKYFSYEGSKRTPPDLMLKNGDALEVKKTETLSTELQLNSSHPKAKLFSNSTLINAYCRNCEEWETGYFIYVIGHLPKSNYLSSLWFIHGEIYAADESVYIDLKNSVSELLEKSDDISFSPTNEIGRINAVDPLKITNLRVRGMWLLQPPYKAFDYVHEYDKTVKFQTITILSSEKYLTYPIESRTKIESDKNITIKDVKVNNPNNPVDLIDAKLITFKLKE